MDPKLVRQWKGGQEAVNRLALEESRLRIPMERFALLEAFLARLAEMGCLEPREDDLEFHLRWQRAREAWLERHGGS